MKATKNNSFFQEQNIDYWQKYFDGLPLSIDITNVDKEKMKSFKEDIIERMMIKYGYYSKDILNMEFSSYGGTDKFLDRWDEELENYILELGGFYI